MRSKSAALCALTAHLVYSNLLVKVPRSKSLLNEVIVYYHKISIKAILTAICYGSINRAQQDRGFSGEQGCVVLAYVGINWRLGGANLPNFSASFSERLLGSACGS